MSYSVNSKKKTINYVFISYFEDLAVGVLDIFDANNDDNSISIFFETEVPYFKANPLFIGRMGSCKKFIAHPTVQNYLTTMWYGQKSIKIGFSQNLKA